MTRYARVEINNVPCLQSFPTGPDPSTVIVCCHGQGGSIERWTTHASALVDGGWNVLIPELPGHGQRCEPGLDVGGDISMLRYLQIVDQAALELSGIADAVLRRFNGSTIVFLGHSIGAEIALLAATRNRIVRHIMAIATVVSDPVWAGPTSPWEGADTPSFEEALRAITIIDRPHLLDGRNIRFIHGLADADAPISEVTSLLDALGTTCNAELVVHDGTHDVSADVMLLVSVELRRLLNITL